MPTRRITATYIAFVPLIALPDLLSARPITVLPMGDSLTNGVGSTDHGAYRTYVKEAFGNAIDFVGRRQDGPIDPENEGWGGFTIPKIRDETVTTESQYNGWGQVVLLTAGTNDLWWANTGLPQQKAERAITDMGSLIGSIFNQSNGIVKTVFVSSIPHIHDWNNDLSFPEVDMYNSALPILVQNLSHEFDVRFVDAGGPLDINWDFADGVHPNDKGYAKMGAAWINALSSVVPEPTSAGAVIALAVVSAGPARRRSRKTS